jgi:hypothetical protein
LTNGGENEGPFSADEGEGDGEEGDDGAEDAGQVDVNVLFVGVGDGAGAGGDVEVEEDDGEVGAREVEGPVVALEFVLASGQKAVGVGRGVEKGLPCM